MSGVIYWIRLFCGIHYLMFSICDDESEFNDDTNKRYHLFNHHKEFEQIKKHMIMKSPCYNPFSTNVRLM